MIPGRSYSEPYMIPGRSYYGPYMIPGRYWQDHSKEICMISMVPSAWSGNPGKKKKMSMTIRTSKKYLQNPNHDKPVCSETRRLQQLGCQGHCVLIRANSICIIKKSVKLLLFLTWSKPSNRSKPLANPRHSTQDIWITTRIATEMIKPDY